MVSKRLTRIDGEEAQRRLQEGLVVIVRAFLRESALRELPAEEDPQTLAIAAIDEQRFALVRLPRQKKVRLPKRLKQVLSMMGRGLKNAGIAEALEISENTVESHIDRLFKLLDVHTRGEACRFAVVMFLNDTEQTGSSERRGKDRR